jgi:hypothetical protein
MALLISGLFKVLIAVLGVLVVRGMLLWFDGTKAGKKFVDERVNKWSEDGQAKYYTGRIIGACILVGLALF